MADQPLSSNRGKKPVGEIYGGEREYRAREHVSLRFIDNDRIIVTFVIREGIVQRRHRSDSASEFTWRLQPILVDASQGKALQGSILPAGSRRAGIVAAEHGRLVVQQEGKLVLYSSELIPIKDIALPRVIGREWQVLSSPSGNALLVVPRDHLPGLWLWIDTNSLKVVTSWEDDLSGTAAISDTEIAMVTCTWRHDCRPTIQLRTPVTTWQTITNLDPGKSSPRFLSDDVLFLSGGPNRFLHKNGVLLLSDTLPGGCSWEQAVPSADAQRLVVPVCDVRGGAPMLDVGGTSELKALAIYDAPFSERSYTLKLRGPKQKGLTYLAVSPNGSRLAVLNNGSLGLIRLPKIHLTGSGSKD